MRSSWLPIWCAAAVAWSATADAQSMSASQILQQFNAVIFQNFTTSSDVDGRTVVGGNMTGGASFAVSPTGEAASSFSALTVYGNETSTKTFNLDGAAGAVIGGTNAGTLDLNGGGSVFVGGANSGAINGMSGGSATVSVVGKNSGQITLSNGGTVYVGAGNQGAIGVNGGTKTSNTVSINGNNNAMVTVNSGGTVKLNGATGNGTLNGGNLMHTSSTTSGWNLNGGATSTKMSSLSLPAPSNALPSFNNTFEAPLIALSNQLNALTANSSVIVSGNSVTLKAAPNAAGIAVLDLSTSVFKANSSVTISLNGASSFIINLSVAGCSSKCTYSFPSSVSFLNPTSYASNVLWNVTDTSSLSFTNEFGGTVLAPTSVVINNAPIDGSLVAMTYTGNGELHTFSFAGNLRVPEPSSLAILTTALLGAGFLVRRRRPTV